MADGQATVSKKGAPRIAYSGEEYGFGYQAAETFVASAKRRRGWVNDGGATRQVLDREIQDFDTPNAKHDFKSVQRQPLRAKEQALLAVKMYTADYAVVPFYHPYYGYDYETLRALASQFGLLAVEQYEATDKLCLAVYDAQVLDIVQQAHPGSGLSTLLRNKRAYWGAEGSEHRVLSRGKPDFTPTTAELAGLQLSSSQQMMLRDRVDLIFCGQEAARRCKSKLDGLRAAGVDVHETLRSVEPHREMARIARKSLERGRQVSTYFDPTDGKAHYVSTMASGAQDAQLYGIVLPFEVALQSEDFTIIDPDFDDSEPAKTRFFVVSTSIDKSLVEDALKTTDARTGYWMDRLREVAKGSGPGSVQHIVSNIMVFGGFLLAGVGLAGLAGWEAIAPIIQTANEASTNMFAASAGVALVLLGMLGKLIQPSTAQGVRVMLKFQRDGVAASLADIENFLRNYGVRHQVVRIDEDSEGKKPAATVLDIEFSPVDFMHNPISMLTRRFRGSVVNGALKKSFQRWKQRGVTILAAMPIELNADGSALKYQLPKHHRRTWYWDAPKAWLLDFSETMQIRFSRLLLWLLPIAFVAYVLWQYTNGKLG